MSPCFSSLYEPPRLPIEYLCGVCVWLGSSNLALALAAEHEVVLELAEVVLDGQHDPARVQAVKLEG
jgi:hypothetical protein